MSEIKLGELITDIDVQRDAIHIAIYPLVAGESLFRGSKVKLSELDRNIALEAYSGSNSIGIVDPFLEHGVEAGQKFWCFLFPNTINGMRHHWQHPMFDRTEIVITEAKRWLLAFCEKWHFNFEDLITEATSLSDYRYIVANGVDLHGADELGEDYVLFWHNLEQYTGQEFDENHREGLSWTCSC